MEVKRLRSVCCVLIVILESQAVIFGLYMTLDSAIDMYSMHIRGSRILEVLEFEQATMHGDIGSATWNALRPLEWSTFVSNQTVWQAINVVNVARGSDEREKRSTRKLYEEAKRENKFW